jgi:hypothetical protein
MRRLTAGLLLACLLSGCWVIGGQPLAALPPGTKDCIGMDEALCLDVIDTLRSGQGLEAVAWRVRCTKVCNANQGEVEATITWSNGTTGTSGMSWEGDLVGPPAGAPGPIGPAGPIPTPAVPPTCVRVPQTQCLEQWTTSLENLSADQWPEVVAVNIECTTSCNLIKGEGTTTVVLKDGTRVEAMSWSYEHAP